MMTDVDGSPRERLWEGVFTEQDVLTFAELSGDSNPIHVDRVAARRLLFGVPVVHGVAGVLTLLDAHLAHGGSAPEHIRVAFRHPIPVGARVQVLRGPSVGGVTPLILRCGTHDATLLSLEGESHPCEQPVKDARPSTGAPADRAFADDGSLSGFVAVCTDVAAMAGRYPAAWAGLGATRVAGFAALSRLVGMVMPGRHSLFTALDVRLVDADARHASTLEWSVADMRVAIAPISLAVSGAGLTGTVQALFRPRPVVQPSIDEVAELVAPAEFEGTRTLVIGGSRGIGELVAKIVASGGGAVTITYARGRSDADRVVEEIRAAGYECSAVCAEADDLPTLIGQLPAHTHVFYLATPVIGSMTFDAAKQRAEYQRVYVGAFRALIASIHDCSWPETSVFYPSTTFVNGAPDGFEDYVEGKLAGERACEAMTDEFPDIRILVRRLPRLATDQTNALVQRPGEPALPILLDVVRDMMRR